MLLVGIIRGLNPSTDQESARISKKVSLTGFFGFQEVILVSFFSFSLSGLPKIGDNYPTLLKVSFNFRDVINNIYLDPHSLDTYYLNL